MFFSDHRGASAEWEERRHCGGVWRHGQPDRFWAARGRYGSVQSHYLVNRHLYGDLDHAVHYGFARKQLELGAAGLEAGIEQYAAGYAGEDTAEISLQSSVFGRQQKRAPADDGRLTTADYPRRLATMIHEILPVGPLHCNCSVIGDEVTREAMVIDPGDEIEDVLALVRKHNLQVKQIVVTHAHIDHVGGAMKLRAATGAPILLNQNDYALLKMLDVQAAWIGVEDPGKVEIDGSVGQADTVRAGSLTANVMHTPGHTEGSVCLYFPLEKKLIAGDTLFAGSIGRTDLPGGSFDKIMDSLHEKVMALPDETVVVPGHGELTTIGEERQSNPFLVKN